MGIGSPCFNRSKTSPGGDKVVRLMPGWGETCLMHDEFDANLLSLADFYFGDSDDPIVPPEDFGRWRRETRRESSLYERSLLGAPTPRVEVDVDGRRQAVINLSSYNYLGLATHPETVAAAREALDDYGTGACGSPLLSGMTDQIG